MKFFTHIPFVEHLGLELVACADGQAEIHLPARPELLNSWQVMHGGVTMTLLDVVMAHAARSLDGLQGPGVVTVEMKTSFMRPLTGTAVAHGTLLHRSTTLAFTEGRVLDASGALCAHASGTFKYLKALPVPGEGRRGVHALGQAGSD